MINDEDVIWVDKVLSGDKNAYARLIKKHEDMVYTLVRRILKQNEESEDITQMVFIKAYQALGSFNKTSLFSTWLNRIAYNTAISEYRKIKNKIYLLDEQQLQNVSDSVADENHSDEKEAQLQLLEKNLQKLEPEDNALISFYYIQNLHIDQISEITNLSPSNVKIRLFRIRKKLHEWMFKETNTYTTAL